MRTWLRKGRCAPSLYTNRRREAVDCPLNARRTDPTFADASERQGRCAPFLHARTLDGAAEAHLLALACGPAPAGQARGRLPLLADRLVGLEHVGSVCYQTIRRPLKKTNYRRLGKNTGPFRPPRAPHWGPLGKTCSLSIRVRGTPSVR